MSYHPDVMAARCADVMELLDPSYKRERFYLPPVCCGSCHDYADCDYYPLCDIDVNGQGAAVCCTMALAWEEREPQ